MNTSNNRLKKVRKLHTAGKKEKAIKLCEKIVSQHPDNGEALVLLGQLYQNAKQLDSALICLDKAKATMSDNLKYYMVRGEIELALLRSNQAIASYEAALRINPQELNAAFGLGVAYIYAQDWSRSINLFRHLSKIWKDKSSVWINLAISLSHTQETQEAEIAATNALKYAPDSHPDVHKALMLLSTIYWERRQLGKVIELASLVLKKNKTENTRALAITMLVRAEAYSSRWEEFHKHCHQMVKIAEGPAAGIIPLDLFLNPKADASTHFMCASKYAKSLFASRRKPMATFIYDRHEPLRVGFLSSDFREHAVSHAFVRCFELLCARKRFSVHAYSMANPHDWQDPLRARIEEASDYFVDVSAYSLENLAHRIHSDSIDILVDLNGHTVNHRISVFSFRPAGIVVNYLGFPGTTGSEFHDWIIGDKFIIPKGEEGCFSEKIWRLPDCYMPTDNTRILAAPPRKSEAGLPNQGFIFACFNGTHKINPDVFDVWCTILKKTPGSVLWLRGSTKEAQDNLVKNAIARGLAKERVIFAPRLKVVEKHLERIALADLSLDTWPYNMHVTCVDTLYAGVPVLTLKGKTFPGRVAESILNAAGLSDLVLATREEYIAKAIHYAKNPDSLKILKKRVRQSQTNSSLFNSSKMALSLENAFVGIYEKETGRSL